MKNNGIVVSLVCQSWIPKQAIGNNHNDITAQFESRRLPYPHSWLPGGRTAAAAASAEPGVRRCVPVEAKRRPQMTARKTANDGGGGYWCLVLFLVHGPWAAEAWPCSEPRVMRTAAEGSDIDALAPGRYTRPL